MNLRRILYDVLIIPIFCVLLLIRINFLILTTIISYETNF